MENIIYLILIKPIELFIEIIYFIFFSGFKNVGISIIFTSIIVNTLWLPLYLSADRIQEEERKKRNSLSRWSEHIKKAFKGDEQYMILNAYYKENNYKFTNQLKSLIPLFLELPFMIAGYHFFSHLEISNISFLIIRDLAMPDALLSWGNIKINILPIIMTAINILSGIFYSKDKSKRDIIQAILIALIFLLILYPCPSALLLYWTFNNIYSLLKNIIIINKSLLKNAIKKVNFFLTKSKNKKSLWDNSVDYTPSSKIYKLSIVFITLFVGIYIPFKLISSSPGEFNAYTRTYVELFFNNFFLVVGVFCVWGNIIYYYLTAIGKRVASLIVWFCSILSIVNFYLWGDYYGNISSLFVYDINPLIEITDFNVILGTEIVFVLILICIIIFIKKPRISLKLSNIMLIFLAILIIFDYCKFINIQNNIGSDDCATLVEGDNIFVLSKNGKNVVFIMLDRGIGAYIPYMFEERPVLKEQFEGFTYYRNALSLGAYTKFSVPSMFGGYEYTPEEINKRSNVLLKDKHDEALMVLPVLFDNSNYNVTVTDQPFAGYSYFSNMSCFDAYPSIRKMHTIGAVNNGLIDQDDYENVQQRRLFFYSISRALPTVVQAMLYDDGNYCGTNNISVILSSFMNSYNVLYNMVDLTLIKDDDSNNYISFQNETTHEPVVLNYNSYDPFDDDDFEFDENTIRYYNELFGDSIKLDLTEKYSHYCVNMASFIQIGNWLEYLKEEGVYDNTRIIIASDHGRGLNQFNELYNDEYMFDSEFFNPILIVKDFDSDEFTTCNDLITIADIPYLLTDGVIENPINPFSNKKLQTISEVYGNSVIVFYSPDWMPNLNAYQFNEDEFSSWWMVNDNLWDSKNWKKISMN